MTCLFPKPVKKVNCVCGTINLRESFMFCLFAAPFCDPITDVVQNFTTMQVRSTNSVFSFGAGSKRAIPSGGPSCPLGWPIRTRDSLHVTHERYQQYDDLLYLTEKELFTRLIR